MKRMVLPIVLALGFIGCNPGTPNPNNPPANPSSFNLTAISSTSINLAWSAVANATGYTLERKTTGAYGAPIPLTTTNYTDAGLSADTTYTYRIKAANAKGSSSGVEKTTKTLSTTPPAGFNVETFKSGLALGSRIWSLNFTPDGSQLLFTIWKASTVQVGAIDMASGNVSTYNSNVAVRNDTNNGSTEAGVLGMELDPNFSSNKKVYICYSYWSGSNGRNRVSSFVLSGSSLTNEQPLLSDMLGGWNHNGCRVVYGPDGKLYITMGEAGNEANAQDQSKLSGKIFRINPDGSIPSDNPFYNQVSGSARAIWTLGHRNPQGLVFQPGTNTLWSTEHGPDINDELNVIEKGKNYGWPNCTGTQASCPGVSNYKPAVAQYEPDSSNTVAPSDMIFYTADTFPQWKGSLLFVTLKTGRLYRLEVSGQSVSNQEILINNSQYGRLRDIATGPDGRIYISTDDGKILRIVPK